MYNCFMLLQLLFIYNDLLTNIEFTSMHSHHSVFYLPLALEGTSGYC